MSAAEELTYFKKWLYWRLLGWLQRKCDHPPEFVSVYLGEESGRDLHWCRICGATDIGGTFFGPRADWWLKP